MSDGRDEQVARMSRRGRVCGALVVPSPPHLLFEYAGAQDVGAGLRARVVAMVAEAIDDLRPGRVVVVTGAERSPRHHLGPVGARLAGQYLEDAGWRGPSALVVVAFDADSGEVAQAARETVGVSQRDEPWIDAGQARRAAQDVEPRADGLGRIGYAEPGTDRDERLPVPAGDTLLIVPADGSATRTEKAPGYIDERAAGVDASVVEALAAGDSATLRELDPQLARELWFTGRAALSVLANVIPTPRRADVAWSEAPFGVQYVLARWDS